MIIIYLAILAFCVYEIWALFKKGSKKDATAYIISLIFVAVFSGINLIFKDLPSVADLIMKLFNIPG